MFLYTIAIKNNIRCFVSSTVKGTWTCHNKECKEASQGRATSFGEDILPFECAHIKAAIEFKHTPHVQYQTDDDREGCLSPGILKDVPFPPSVLAEFESCNQWQTGWPHSSCVRTVLLFEQNQILKHHWDYYT